VGFFAYTQKSSPQSTSSKLNVVASFYPIGEFARAVGGELVDVNIMTPSGVEPHDYEPTAKQIGSLSSADVFLFNGGGVDVWATRLQDDLASRGVRVVEMSSVMDVLLPPVEHEEDESTHDEEESFDPHFWLDPKLVKKEVKKIEEVFSERDPLHAKDYKKNADAYLLSLDALDLSFQNGLRSCGLRKVVTSHAAFSYLAKAYSFEVMAIAGLSPEEEPSAGQMAEIARLAKKNGVKHIFFETLVNPKLSETIASEIGAKTLVFNPLEGLTEEEVQQGETYLTVMNQNLKNLKIAMMCQ